MYQCFVGHDLFCVQNPSLAKIEHHCDSFDPMVERHGENI